MYGLKDKHINAINSVFSKYPQIEKAILYGSRAKGNYRNGSDIDLTLVGDDLDLTTLLKIENQLDDLLLPYKMDLSILHQIENQDLIEHIDRVGIVFYEKVVNEWKQTEFAKILENESISYGIVQPGSHIEIGGIPIIRVQNIKNGKIYTKDIKKVSKKIEEGYLRTRLKGGELLITVVGSVGKCAIVSNKFEGWNVARAVSVARIKEEYDKNFIRYCFLTEDIKFQMYGNTNDTVQPTLNLKELKSLKLNLPKLPKQKAIAEILTSLDDKIDLLHRQNKTLEGMAETLYDSWVFEKDFDSTIKDLINIQNGYAFKSKNFQDTGIHRVLKIKNISGGIVNIQTTDFVSDETVLKIDKKFKIKTGDILFAMTGAKIGKMGIIPQTEYSLWLNQRVGLFKEKFNGARFLAYLHLKSDFGFDYIENTATGSAQPNISGTGIEDCEFPKFKEEEIKEYSKQLELLYEKVFFNLGQVRKLEQIRDVLLPKLMSGEIKVVENE